MRFSVCKKVTKSARIGSILNSVFKTLMVFGSWGSNHLAKSKGYFSASSLQTLSKLIGLLMYKLENYFGSPSFTEEIR
jgi:hypothetical protein